MAKSRIVCVFFKKYLYFCHMKEQQTTSHPLLSNLQKIKDEGIVVLDDVRGMPTGDEPFVSSDYVICIGHKGRIKLLYDNRHDYFAKHTVGVVFPNHSVSMVSKTDDYLATLIAVDASVPNDPMLQIINQMRFRYESHPCVKLDRHEYKMITDVVEGMREIKRLNLPDSRMLMTRLLEFLLRLLSHYRKSKLNEYSADKRVSMQFHSDLAQHFRSFRLPAAPAVSHDARMAVIKEAQQDLGQCAVESDGICTGNLRILRCVGSKKVSKVVDAVFLLQTVEIIKIEAELTIVEHGQLFIHILRRCFASFLHEFSAIDVRNDFFTVEYTIDILEAEKDVAHRLQGKIALPVFAEELDLVVA